MRQQQSPRRRLQPITPHQKTPRLLPAPLKERSDTILPLLDLLQLPALPYLHPALDRQLPQPLRDQRPFDAHRRLPVPLRKLRRHVRAAEDLPRRLVVAQLEHGRAVLEKPVGYGPDQVEHLEPVGTDHQGRADVRRRRGALEDDRGVAFLFEQAGDYRPGHAAAYDEDVGRRHDESCHRVSTRCWGLDVDFWTRSRDTPPLLRQKLPGRRDYVRQGCGLFSSPPNARSRGFSESEEETTSLRLRHLTREHGDSPTPVKPVETYLDNSTTSGRV